MSRAFDALYGTGVHWVIMGLVLSGCLPARVPVFVSDLRVEHMSAPINIDTPTPRFSWKLESNGYRVRQTAYRIEVEDADEGKLTWDSGEVKNGRQLWIPYEGRPLHASGTYRWRAAVSVGGKPQWSEWTDFQTALLEPEDWSAKWIQADYSLMAARPVFRKYERRLPESEIAGTAWIPDAPYIDQWVESATLHAHNLPKEKAADFQRDRLNEIKPAPMFRKEFAVKPGLKRAVLHGCGLGLAEWSVNGNKLGKATFDPAVTDYDKRAFYQTFDVTDHLEVGPNAVGAILGEGWFGESMAYATLHRNNRYGDPGLIAQLELIYQDGSRARVVSDASWQVTLEGPVVKNGIWCGSVHDARREMPGWNRPGFRTGDAWAPAVEVGPLSPRLEAQNVEKINIVETTAAKEIMNPQPGVWVVDLGRIVSGVVRLKLRNQPPGTAVLLTYGQALDLDGSVWGVGNMSVSSNNSDLYLCKGGAEETWIPRFTFTAFRYVQVEGLKGAPDLETVTGLFTSTDMPAGGKFECSVPLFNGMHHAFRRTTQANTRHMFTDTPTRERTGWMTWPNARAIIANFDSYSYWDKYIADWRTSASMAAVGDHVARWVREPAHLQFDSGRKGETIRNVGPCMAPWHRRSNIPEQRLSNALYPLETYIRFGDRDLIRDHYEVAKNTLDAIQATRMDGLVPSLIGDWHDAVTVGKSVTEPAASDERPAARRAEAGLDCQPARHHPPGARAGARRHLWAHWRRLSGPHPRTCLRHSAHLPRSSRHGRHGPHTRACRRCRAIRPAGRGAQGGF